MLAYLYALLAGDVDAVRAALLYGSLAGGIIVVGGLLWEAGKINWATAVVILGVCLESFCTWRLFVVDESVSNSQKSTILAQQSQIIALLRVAPRIASNPNGISDKLRPFGPLVAVVSTTMALQHAFDIDPLTSQIADVLKLAGWKIGNGGSWAGPDRPSGVWVSAREGETDAALAAETLINELNAAGIVAHRLPKPFNPPKPPRPPDPPPQPPPQTPFAELHTAVLGRAAAFQRLQEWEQMPDIQVIVGTKP